MLFTRLSIGKLLFLIHLPRKEFGGMIESLMILRMIAPVGSVTPGIVPPIFEVKDPLLGFTLHVGGNDSVLTLAAVEIKHPQEAVQSEVVAVVVALNDIKHILHPLLLKGEFSRLPGKLTEYTI